MSDRFTKLLHYILPSFLLEHFDLSDIQETDGILHITLEELNVVPAEFSGQKLLSKGFFKSIDVQDFPIREQRVYLKLNGDAGSGLQGLESDSKRYAND